MPTTPIDPRVLDTMMPWMQGYYGNPHSRSHAYGWDAETAVEKAREQIPSLINADPKEIFFTSGATESNNLAVKGVSEFHGKRKNHIVTTQIEHKCVLASCRRLQVEKGWDVTYLPVDTDGLIDLNLLERSIRKDTALVSIIHGNNEIGVVQPLNEIGKICKAKKVFLHTDAAQTVGKMPVDVKKNNIALLSISGHKIYGPKGIGAVYVRRRPRVRVRPVLDGGGQERGLRSGTLPTQLVVGLGKAAELCEHEMDRDHRHTTRMFDLMYNKIKNELPKTTLNGSLESRLVGNINMSFACVEGESLLMRIAPSTAVSSGSACTSASLEPSYVLRAIGVNEELAHTSLRFGVGRFTTEEEVIRTSEHLVKEVERLRNMSPLWEMELEADASGHKEAVTWS